MKLKFDTVYRGLLLALLLSLAWGIWASAQSTNQPAPATNHPSAFVRGLEQLDDHFLTFGLDRVPLLRDLLFLGEPLWKYLASLIYILLAFCVSHVIDLITNAWLKRLAAKTHTRLDDLLLEVLHGPLKIVAFVILLYVGLGVFEWSATAKVYLSKVLVIVVAAALTYLAIKVLGIFLDAWKRRIAHDDRRFNDQLFGFLRKSLNAFIVIVAILVTASNLNINMTAAITSLSIGGLAVGLAAQDTLGNLFGAVAVLTDKPFRAGDQIRLDGAEGTVESIGLRSTRVRNSEGHLVAVPNKTMGNAIITNISQRPGIRTSMNLILVRSLPVEKIKRALEILQEVYKGDPKTEDVWISFNQFAAGNINIQVIHWWKGTDHKTYLQDMQRMNLEVKSRFDAEAITFA